LVLRDFLSDKDEDNFFEEASGLIYNWLSDEEKLQLNLELIEEETINIKNLKPKLRFFRLLHFLYVKYIRVDDWVIKLHVFLETINSKTQKIIVDLKFKDTNEEEVSLLEYSKKLRSANLKSFFEELLEQTELKEEFNFYIDSLNEAK
jgi:hypothetical protein